MSIDQKQQGEAAAEVAASALAASFDAAVAALYSDTHQATTRDAIRAAAARRQRTVEDMHEYMNRIGLSSMFTDGALKNKRLIHITGTKGKGSTAAMCECICRNTKSWTTGLFTSPHLIDIRERIRINGKPVSKQIFAQAYWEIRRRLENYNTNIIEKNAQKPSSSSNDEYEDDDLPILPGYFRMLSLLALFIFTHHQDPVIDVIILEVGLGGRYDATNVLDLDLFRASVCGVTLIDYDHVRILGHSLEEIAWEKGGIFQVIKKQQGESSSTSTTISPRPSPANHSTQHCPSNRQEEIQEESDDQHHKEMNDATANGRVFYSLASNTDSVLDVLRTCAFIEGRGGRLVTVSSCNRKLQSRNVNNDMDKSRTASTSTTSPQSSPLALGLHGDHQWDNAALAVALCKHVMNMDQNSNEPSSSSSSSTTTTLDKNDDDDADDEMYRALSHVSWPGRCQTIHRNQMTFFLDGAHTVQSIQAGLEWFQQQQAATIQAESNSHDHGHDCPRPRRLRALLFNCSHEREPVQLLQLLLRGVVGHGNQQCDDASGTSSISNSSSRSFGFDVVFFCRSNTDRPSSIDKTNAIDLLKAAGYQVQQQQDEVLFSSMTKTGRTWQDTLLEVWEYLVQYEIIHQEAKSNGSTTNLATAAQVTASNLTALEALRRLEGIMVANNNNSPEKLPLSSTTSSARMDVFVTGSLYLAGSVLEALEWAETSQTEGCLAISLGD